MAAKVDETKCGGCGTCVDACPFEAIKLDNVAVIDPDACQSCGACTSACPCEAITLED